MAKRGAGEGSIYKRGDGRWVGAFMLPDGLRKSLYARTRGEVSTRLREAQQKAADGLPVAAGRTTIAAFLRWWLENRAAPTVRPRTLEAYTSIVEQHLIPALGKARLSALTPDSIVAFMNRQTAKGLSARSVQFHHAVLRRALGDAERMGYVARNVARLASAPRVERHEISPMTAEQARTFLGATLKHPLHTLFVLAMSSGARQGELLALSWQDVDFTTETIAIRATLHRRSGAFQREVPKTKTSRRTLALAPQAVASLHALRAKQNEARLRASSLWEQQDWQPVFTDDRGRPLAGYNVTKAFQAALKVCGLPRQRFHDTRHGVATYMLSEGVPLKVIQTVLGHSTISVTANTYSHVMPDLERDAVQRVAGVLWAG